MAIGKSVGKIAGKVLDLTQKAAKKLEDYGAKSAVENQNENAKKLEIAMNKLSQKIEENAEELEGSLKKFCKDVQNRAEAAKQKASEDVKQNNSDK